MADAEIIQHPAPYVDIADVEHFLAHGLNMTPDELATWLGEQREKMARSGMERDHDDYATIPYDDLADLMDMAERLLVMWHDDTHVLKIDERGWEIQHPIRCRPDLLGCEIHRLYSEQADEEWPGYTGKYTIKLNEDAESFTTHEVR